MSILDIIISLVVLAGLWRGYQHGVVKTFGSLIAWAAALIIASKWADELSIFLTMIDNRVFQIALAFVLIVLAVLLLVQMMAGALTKTINALHIGFLNRIAGGLLGAMLGVLKILMVLSVAAPLLVQLPIWKESILAQNLLPYAPMARVLIGKTVGEAVHQLENPYQSL
ncbi:CvpA family protein [Moraxella nasicaprae]|uniref:CvpA family protein n=1 Tax=Moraxella nasicaprae TaxID=2904122 RepID=A0ABY6F3V3_9GAMM|nr:CvpA family protein [Moraxella nasicaprae]UXZ04779.1 CvpA family protein [Moraxella nasicaprae]